MWDYRDVVICAILLPVICAATAILVLKLMPAPGGGKTQRAAGQFNRKQIENEQCGSIR